MKSLSESGQVVVPHQISQKMQHLVGKMKDARKAGSSGLDGLQGRPW